MGEVSKVDQALATYGEPDPRVVARRLAMSMTPEERDAAFAWAFPLAVTVRVYQAAGDPRAARRLRGGAMLATFDDAEEGEG